MDIFLDRSLHIRSHHMLSLQEEEDVLLCTCRRPFYRESCASTVLAVIVCLSVCLSVRLSQVSINVCLVVSINVCLVSRSCTKMAKPRITSTTLYDSSGRLVFWRQESPWNSNQITPNWGTPNKGWVCSKRFSTNILLYLTNGAR